MPATSNIRDCVQQQYTSEKETYSSRIWSSRIVKSQDKKEDNQDAPRNGESRHGEAADSHIASQVIEGFSASHHSAGVCVVGHGGTGTLRTKLPARIGEREISSVR